MDPDVAPKPAKKPAEKPADATPNDDGIPEGDETPAPEKSAKPDETPAAPDVDPAKMGARDLRKAYESTQKKIKEELQPTIQKLTARVRELETAKPEETPALAAKYKSIETRNQELENHIRLIDYQQSQEFKDKYWQPYVEAWEGARGDLAQLTVEMPDGTTRAATDDDIWTLAGLPLGERRTKANAMFGDSADDIMGHVKEIDRLVKVQNKAVKEAKENANAMAERQKVQSAEEHRVRGKLWTDTNKELTERFPHIFAPVEGDEDGNRILDQGHALTDLLFAPHDMTPQERLLLPKFVQKDLELNGKLSRESTVRVHAIIKNKAANHDRMARQLKTIRAELEAAKKTLGEYEASAPETGGRATQRRTESSDPMGDADAELDALDRKGR